MVWPLKPCYKKNWGLFNKDTFRLMRKGGNDWCFQVFARLSIVCTVRRTLLRRTRIAARQLELNVRIGVQMIGIAGKCGRGACGSNNHIMMKPLFSCTGNTTGNASQSSAPRTYSLIRGHRQSGKYLIIVDIQARHLRGYPCWWENQVSSENGQTQHFQSMFCKVHIFPAYQ